MVERGTILGQRLEGEHHDHVRHKTTRTVHVTVIGILVVGS